MAQRYTAHFKTQALARLTDAGYFDKLENQLCENRRCKQLIFCMVFVGAVSAYPQITQIWYEATKQKEEI